MIDPEDIAKWIGAVSAAIVGSALWMRKGQTKWKSEGAEQAKQETERAVAEASATVIEQMRNELVRMAKVNTELAEQVNKFQMENIHLHARLQTVTLQMTDLQHENAELGLRIAELTQTIEDFKKMITRCEACKYKQGVLNDPA